MERVKFDNDESYIGIINDKLKDFDNYNLVTDKINTILKSIDKDIKEIIVFDDGNLSIMLYGDFYGINYDNKNYPLLSFYCKSLTFNVCDCGIVTDEFSDVTLNLYEIDLKNFVKME